MEQFDDDFRRRQDEGGANTSRNIVRYDEYSSGALDWLSPIGSRSDRSRFRNSRRNKERWSPSSSSLSSASSAGQPRAEFSFPLHWKNTPETTNTSRALSSSSSSWPILSWDHHRRSRITASTTLPLYQSQDALMDYPSSSYDDDTNSIHKKGGAVEPKKYHRREILCKLSMTTLQHNFFQPEGVDVFGSLSLKATQYHNNNNNNNDDYNNDREKTSLILTAHRQQTDVLTVNLDHHGGERYAISAILTKAAAAVEGNNPEESSSPPPTHLRLRAHWNNNNVIIFHRSRVPMMVQIRPDISMIGSSSSSSLFTIDPEVGISILHQDWRHNHIDSRTQHAARSVGHVRFGWIYTNQSWKPSVRLHWSYPFWGSFHWQQGGTSSTAIQYEALWKSSNHHRSNFQMSVATHDMFNAVAWKWIISFTLSDVTIRFPIIIDAANTWQLHMVHWGLASVVSHLLTSIVQDFLQQQQQRRNKQSNMDSSSTRDESRKGDRRRTALMQQHFMERQAILRYRDEMSRNGLLIDSAIYRYKEVSLDVTIPLRFWVTDSKLELFAVDHQRPLMLGFYNLVEESHGSTKTTLANDDDHGWSFAEMIKSIIVQVFTVFPAKTVSSTDHARNSQNEGSILEICYRFHGTRYTISLGDDEHVVLPCLRAELISD